MLLNWIIISLGVGVDRIELNTSSYSSSSSFSSSSSSTPPLIEAGAEVLLFFRKFSSPKKGFSRILILVSQSASEYQVTLRWNLIFLRASKVFRS